ncbi:hypothetical protein [Leptospira santarosai]|uniref:hypothetical protein n=1 Tax=Leptospira santarosai TaxID=28183 RepID=UPI000BB9E5B5|nr:hypothetical protein [Leptospira santarosai]ASV13415.1 hypothetical protein B2G51_17680 [Leptospira santarosai]MDO6383677.1 hypothetical protein [Leptospira santarosai]
MSFIKYLYSKIGNYLTEEKFSNRVGNVLILIGVFFLINLVLSCRQVQIESKPAISIGSVIKENLFSSSSGMHSLYIKFNDNGSYEFSYDSEGWTWFNRGTYLIKNNTIELKSNFCSSGEHKGQVCSATFHNGKCIIEPTPLDVEYEYALICRSNHNFKVFSSDSKPSNLVSFEIKQFLLPAGNERVYKGHKIITMGNIIGEVTEPVVLRDGPGINYQKLDYIVNVYDGPYLKSLQKGKKVIIHGRTLKKETVKNWENYWLLISIDDTNKVWAFGQFFVY